MSRELDKRDHTRTRTTPARKHALRSTASALSDRLPGQHRINITRFDDNTGNPAVIQSESAPAIQGDYVERALAHVRGIGPALGFELAQSAEFIADPDYQTTSGGAVAVHLQQQLHGIPIVGATKTVRFSADGRIKETIGGSLTITQGLTVAPQISAQNAVMRAATHVATPDTNEQNAADQFGESMYYRGVDLNGFEPAISAAFPEKPDRLSVFEAGPFASAIKANLVWFYVYEELRLTWQIIISMPDNEGQYRTLVDAGTGEILYCKQQLKFIAARGNVYRVDGRNPRQPTDFPRPLTDYGLPTPASLPATFPEDWVATNQTIGNSVFAHLGASGPAYQGASQGGVVQFNPSNAVGDDQKVLNIFYFNCVMHDFYYLLGFREADGNFQQNNFGRGGAASDRVDARAHSGPVNGTANMGTPPDGLSPQMNMGLVASTNRHTAFDSSVVYHEFTHGVTNRLVGGSGNAFALEDPQSGGMGEGWSDYFACTINNTIVVGDWVTNNPGGIRQFPYDSSFPDHFGMLGTGRYSNITPNGDPWPHPIGEIWCATLLEMNRRVGTQLSAQLVFDALKLSDANPSFLDSRDAILAALEAMLDTGIVTATEHATHLATIWQVFARFGMGMNAQSNGAFLTGIVPDINVPGQVVSPSPFDVTLDANPNLPIPDDQAVGVSDFLTVNDAGVVSHITVSVNIEHTYIGDLHVRLISSAGTSVDLHNRGGGRSDNLIASYSSDDVIALEQLLGEPALGDWTLNVVDLAGADIGVLKQWRLEMDLAATGQTIQARANPAVNIPDNDVNGVTSAINIARSGTLNRVMVSVDITHTYIGDLRITLRTPSGEQALLHDQFGRGEDNLIRTYDSITSPSLFALAGQSARGDWELHVADLLGQDTGKLNKWGIELVLD